MTTAGDKITTRNMSRSDAGRNFRFIVTLKRAVEVSADFWQRQPDDCCRVAWRPMGRVQIVDHKASGIWMKWTTKEDVVINTNEPPEQASHHKAGKHTHTHTLPDEYVQFSQTVIIFFKAAAEERANPEHLSSLDIYDGHFGQFQCKIISIGFAAGWSGWSRGRPGCRCLQIYGAGGRHEQYWHAAFRLPSDPVVQVMITSHY